MNTTKRWMQVTVAALWASAAGAQDLPYDSGSTGADGPFAVNLGNTVAARYLHAGAFDAARGEVVVANGGYISGFPAGTSLAFRNDTLVWNGTHWTTRGAGPGTLAQESAMAYDAVAQKVIAYGGRNSGGTYLTGGASWNGVSWTTLANAAPGARGHHAMAYDAAAQKVILYGGWSGAAALDTTFAWNDAGSNWVNQAPAVSPPARYHHAMCWDAARAEIVLFGGYSGAALADTWVWRSGNWTQKLPANSPPARYSHALGYDPASGKVVCYSGYTGGDDYLSWDTWLWDGSNWTEVATTRALTARHDEVLVTDTARNQLLLIGGHDYEYAARDDTWRWDGSLSNWVQLAGSLYRIDMAAKPDGVWHYTSITVPAGITVEFAPNAGNRAVTWLATEDVTINGTVSVNGMPAMALNNYPGEQARGGPGGFDGGIGGTRVEVFNTRAGTPGQGPGGGDAGIATSTAGANGRYQGVYGNAYVIPLMGGSGGGGAAANVSNADGGNGGGGGGAILIASSRDITISGAITANGGYVGLNTAHNGVAGGYGSGGAVKLVADRIFGSGDIEARNGAGITTGNVGGYVRLESYLRPFDISGTVTAGNRSNAAPVMGVNYGGTAALYISAIDGAAVAQPPGGTFHAPDVVFSNAGPVAITVTATNIPDGTPVSVRIAHSAGIFNLPAVNLAAGAANFATNIPNGFGTVQAFATYDIIP